MRYYVKAIVHARFSIEAEDEDDFESRMTGMGNGDLLEFIDNADNKIVIDWEVEDVD
jgi:hypothetical protein